MHGTSAACLAIDEYPWCLAHPACIISIRRGAWHTAAEVAVAAQQHLLTARSRNAAPDHPVLHRSADGHRGYAAQAERRLCGWSGAAAFSAGSGLEGLAVPGSRRAIS